MRVLNEFTINQFITVRLENEETVIYVNGDRFNQCKYLLLNIPIENNNRYDELGSIDEAAEVLDRSMERQKDVILPQVEFWGHCSNLQAWAENNYDTRLIHSNLAFPLLKRLTNAGDPLAKRVFKDEIAKRFSSGYLPVINYLTEKKYLNYLTTDEVEVLLEDIREHMMITSDFDKMIAKSPFLEYLIGLSRKFYYIRNNWKKAIKYFKLILQFVPQHVSTWLLLIKAYRNLDKPEKAREAIDRAIQIDSLFLSQFKDDKIIAEFLN